MRALILLMGVVLILADPLDDILYKRFKLYEKEEKMMLGSDIQLSKDELAANQTIMDLKIKELDSGFVNQNFSLSKYFFEYKDEVKKNRLFQLIARMPKGALLHAHDTGMLGPDYLLRLTYKKNLYVSFYKDDVCFYFSKTVPKFNTSCPCHAKWQLLKDLRYASGNIQQFDENLRKYFTMQQEDKNFDTNVAWQRFQKCFMVVAPLLQYKPVWEQYFNDTLYALKRDNVMYLEIRSLLPELYDLEGRVYDSVETAETYKKVADDFVIANPDFFGVKLIYAPSRQVNKNTLTKYLETAREIKKRMPDFFAGFDLVGQEDMGQTLTYFLPELSNASDEFDLFLHAGETSWNGDNIDNNIFDAIALGTKRIAHGYSLFKHPVLMEEVKKRMIPIEVNVISNAVLKLVHDVRNHPLANWLAQGLPVVLSSDDPGMWEATPLTHDFYVTFVAVANRHADLRLLKKLALNSIHYSTYPEKLRMLEEFENRWERFILTLR